LGKKDSNGKPLGGRDRGGYDFLHWSETRAATVLLSGKEKKITTVDREGGVVVVVFGDSWHSKGEERSVGYGGRVMVAGFYWSLKMVEMDEGLFGTFWLFTGGSEEWSRRRSGGKEEDDEGEGSLGVC
ncbi:hypothetical protein HAX54_014834, partial [Datura stramonium]|nr:hypothetical protein [Datura stramonium]